MTFPKYPEYKDSGIEWLGEVPSHWELRKISHGFNRIGSGTTPPSNEKKWYEGGSIPWVTTSELRENLILETKKSITDEALSEFTSLQVHPPGSLAIAMYGATIGRLGIFGVSATTNQACCVLSGSKSIGPRFAFYWLLAFKNEIVSLYATGGGQPNINQETIASLRLPAPSLEDQAKIAAFLDHETSLNDALVKEQQRLIELLKEKRQAVISHAVTKGLDPDVPMKDSGVEWLGEVPAHWEVAPLKYLAKEKVAGPYGASLTKAMYTASGYRVYGQQQVIPNDFSLGDYYISQEKFEEMIRYQVFPGDVLFSVMGTVGKVAVVPPEVEPGIINPRLVRYRFFRRVNPDFIRLLVMSQNYQRSLQESAQGSTMEGLNMSILGDLPILLPDPEEQGEIVAWLTKESSLLEELVSQAEHAMELLNERRSALISAAVTGKIDVRGWQAKQQADQSEMLMAAEARATYG